jgi:3-phenylpropionate/cinnamic acid dioxygenase small subunit
MEAADESRARLDDPEGAMTMAQPAHDPSRYSYYVDDALYQELIADFATLRQDHPTIEDHAERDLFRGLVEREARLLDGLQFEQWLQFYADECLYWVPGTPNGGDPRREIAVMFDDRRRLEDRVFRLSTGFAWSQAPSSRTVRLVSNIEVFASGNPEQRLVRSNFLINEFWDDETRALAGWAGHRFRRIDGAWRISAKQVNLLVCDQCIRNPSIIF